MASLAELLDYDQRKRQALQALTDYASSQYKLGSAFGEGLSDQAKGLWQTVRHPIDTAVDTATNIYQAGKAAIQDPRAAYQAAKEGLTEAVSSPQNIARFAGQNFNPLELANALNKVGTMRELTVYHGTPHKFEPTPENPLGEFTASKIGTGEGAAAYGHGIYTAQNPKIALSYKRNLSSKDEIPNVNYKGQHYLNRIPELVGAKGEAVRNIAEVLREDLPFNEAKARAKAMAQYEYDRDLKSVRAAGLSDEYALHTPEEHKNILNEIDNLDSSIVQRVGEPKDAGYLYTADLPDEKIDQMLDWDKPLSEQPHVIKALANADDEFRAYRQQLSPKFQKIADDMVTGKLPVHGDEAMKSWEALQRAYPNLDHNAIHDVRYRIFPNTSEGDWLHSVLSGSAAPGSGVRGGGGADLYNSLGGGAEASAKLRAAGIPGIKYLDEGSRATGLTPHYDLVRKKDGAVVWQVTEGGNALEQAKKLAASGDFELKGPTDKRTRNFVVFPGEEKSLKILSRE